jgi:hypothetical protein
MPMSVSQVVDRYLHEGVTPAPDGQREARNAYAQRHMKDMRRLKPERGSVSAEQSSQHDRRQSVPW